ncbi:MAG: hypothetical protein KF716_33455 [Anaerolineae bacterium]|nr:hypothetical protein [Anaerolineae bacterium]
MPRRTRPVGQPTRGKTALNRLRQIDVFIALTYADVLSSGSPLIVDVGYGAQAWTALEMRERWLTINPRLRLLGLEIDAERVAVAQPYAQQSLIEFKLGGFNVRDATNGERARMIRAYNVLRQYEETEVPAAILTMANGLEDGGILIEGTSNPTGRMVVSDVYRKVSTSLRHEMLVFGTNFREALEPVDFQTILPKRLIHHMRDDAPLRFFEAWRRGLSIAKGAGRTNLREQWISAGNYLRDQAGYPIDPRERLLRRGYLALRDPLLPLAWLDS